MEGHGDYTIQLIGNVVHVFPIGGFNEQGIEELQQAILKAAPKSEKWALLEHPKGMAGLTPEAAEQLISGYLKFSRVNCAAIGLEVSSVWKMTIERVAQDKLMIPLFCDSDGIKVESLIQHYLEDIQ